MSKIIIILSALLLFFIGCANKICLPGDTGTTTYPDISIEPEADSFQLSGRFLVDSLSKTDKDIVVVKIKVDRNGYVVSVEYSFDGSTTRDSRLVSAALKAATKVRFNKDPKAPAIANGTITYHFEPDEIRMYEEREFELEGERKRQEEIERQKKGMSSNVSNAFDKSTKSSTSEGDTKESGNQGQVTGDPNSKNRSGSGFGSKGDGFQLAGRSLVGSLPKPQYSIQEEGIVVVRIKVDRKGYVVGAEYSLKGSTTQDSRLVNAAIKAAKQTKFNKDPKAPAFVYGTITYHFELDEIRMYEERELELEGERKRQEEIERQKKAISSNVSNAFGKSSGSSTRKRNTKSRGYQGYVTGDPNSKNRSGSGPGSKGDGFQLAGRSLVGSLPKPQYSIPEEGIVVVRIKVDRKGYVVGVEYSLKGSTTQDSRLVNAAIKAAKQARFNKDPKAPAFVYGTITYHFELD